MEPAVIALFVCRSLVCVLGIIGNGALLVSVLKQSGFKTFEIFLAGMASSNLVESLLVDMPDLLTELAGLRPERWFCKVLKLMSGVGETGSILFTLLICVFRYQKLRDAATRVSLPTVLDRVRNAWLLSAVSWVVAFSFSLPSALMELPKEDQFVSYGQGNETDSRACSSDLFDCPLLDCSLGRQVYKMAYMLLLNGLPLVIVLVCSFLMVKVLYHNHKALSDQPPAPGPEPRPGRPGRQAAFQRSTRAVLAALFIFQLAWILHLVFQFALDSQEFPYWSHADFFLSASYSTASPYIYAIGNNLFRLKSCF
ncbi:hypothetical protein HHUSO_G19462 [Huso huso]|uniref:G-protein coupled receptors family 1 profile domain-containing protein n=1 Tax=Huso huso TaxID=61971 RepID=A0ABR0Z1Y3_HUSHU